MGTHIDTDISNTHKRGATPIHIYVDMGWPASHWIYDLIELCERHGEVLLQEDCASGLLEYSVASGNLPWIVKLYRPTYESYGAPREEGPAILISYSLSDCIAFIETGRHAICVAWSAPNKGDILNTIDESLVTIKEWMAQ